MKGPQWVQSWFLCHPPRSPQYSGQIGGIAGTSRDQLGDQAVNQEAVASSLRAPTLSEAEDIFSQLLFP